MQNIRCLKCGELGHKVAQCPKRQANEATAHAAQEQAPFVCYTDVAEEEKAHLLGSGLTSEEAMKREGDP